MTPKYAKTTFRHLAEIHRYATGQIPWFIRMRHVRLSHHAIKSKRWAAILGGGQRSGQAITQDYHSQGKQLSPRWPETVLEQQGYCKISSGPHSLCPLINRNVVASVEQGWKSDNKWFKYDHRKQVQFPFCSFPNTKSLERSTKALTSILSLCHMYFLYKLWEL